MLKKFNLTQYSDWWLRCLRVCAWPILIVAVILAVLAVQYTFAHLSVRTNRKDLVGSDQRLIKISEKLDKSFGGRDGLVVVVDAGGDNRKAIAFANDLAVRLRRLPQEFRELFYRINPETLKSAALLYLDAEDLTKIKDNILAQKTLLTGLAADPRLTTFFSLVNTQISQAMIGQVFTGFLEEKKAELPDVSLLNSTLAQLQGFLGGKSAFTSPLNAFFPKDIMDLADEEGYFFTDSDKYLMFLVTPEPDGFTTISNDVALLRKIVDQVKERYPGVQAGVTGPDALQADEMSSSMKDITLATWLSLAGQMGLMILFLRSLRRPLVEGVVLIIGLCWTFALVTLVVGHLNLLSMVFAPLMLGLTIDYGIHWFARLEEEQGRRARCSSEILACTFRRSAPGITYAGLAAAVSFLPLAFVGFKGLAELGLILTMGILVMLVATLLLVPPLIIILERCDPSDIPEECPPQPSPFLHLHWTRPWIIVVGGIIIALLGIVSLHFVPFDLNPLHLQNPNTESVVWENNLIKNSKYSTSYGAVATASLPELEARTAALKKLPTISHVESVLSFIPTHIKEKRRLIAEILPVLNSVRFPKTPAGPSDPQELADILSRINFKMDEAAKHLEEEKAASKEQIQETHLLINQIIPLLDPGRNPQVQDRLTEFSRKFFRDMNDKWDLFRGYARSSLTAKPISLSDLPEQVRVRFVSESGLYLLRVFPAEDIWNFGPLKRFVQSLWSVDPNAAGDPILLYTFTLGFRNAILWASGLALLAIFVMLVLLFRSLKMGMLALIPLLVGTGLTLNMMWLLDLPFNQANVLFLPLILGEGIEFGIIILARWRLEESARAITLPASTAKGVALAALTTTVGFGSLMVSGHRGTFSLGLLATVGSLSVLLASLSALPAFLRVVERSYGKAHPSVKPYFGLGRWLNPMVRKKDDEKTALDH